MTIQKSPGRSTAPSTRSPRSRPHVETPTAPNAKADWHPADSSACPCAIRPHEERKPIIAGEASAENPVPWMSQPADFISTRDPDLFLTEGDHMNRSNSSPVVGMGAIAVILAWLLGAALVIVAIVLAVLAVIALVGWLFDDGAEDLGSLLGSGSSSPPGRRHARSRRRPGRANRRYATRYRKPRRPRYRRRQSNARAWM